jgi:hypothetical protein
MKGTMITITPAGEFAQAEIDVPDDLHVPLARIHAALGGYLELIPYFDSYKREDGTVVRCVAFCNEDGKRLQLPLNIAATALWQGALERTPKRLAGPLRDRLVGNVVVLFGDREFMESL